MSKLQKLGVSYVVGNACKCSTSQMAYTYKLPYVLDLKIEKPFSSFGKSSTSLQKQSIMKIENENFSITGIKGLKSIKLIIKNPEFNYLVEEFENALIMWLETRLDG